MKCRYYKYFEAIWLVQIKFAYLCQNQKSKIQYEPQINKFPMHTYTPCLHTFIPQSLLSIHQIASMAATSASSTSVIRATQFLGRNRGSNVNSLRDSVSMVNGKFTMVLHHSLCIYICVYLCTEYVVRDWTWCDLWVVSVCKTRFKPSKLVNWTKIYRTGTSYAKSGSPCLILKKSIFSLVRSKTIIFLTRLEYFQISGFSSEPLYKLLMHVNICKMEIKL